MYNSKIFKTEVYVKDRFDTLVKTLPKLKPPHLKNEKTTKKQKLVEK